jgi:serine/threonine-protein phosphatase 6 regulatory ankyrin repeat subunit B
MPGKRKREQLETLDILDILDLNENDDDAIALLSLKTHAKVIHTSGLLHYVISKKRDKLFDFLISQCDIITTIGNEETCLHYAINHNYIYGLIQLLKHKDKNKLVNMVTLEGQSALHYAVKCQNIECIRLLLKHGINKFIKDTMDKTALIYAFELDNMQIIKLLQLDGYDSLKCITTNSGIVSCNYLSTNELYSTEKDTGLTTLHWLICTNQPSEYIEQQIVLLQQMNEEQQLEQFNKKTSSGYTALHYAVMKQDIGLIQRLINLPVVEIDIENEDDITPLFLATALQNIDIVKILIKKNASVLTLPTDTRSSFIRTISLSNIKILKIFIDNDKLDEYFTYITINGTHDGFADPLAFSLEHNILEIFELLLKEYDVDDLYEALVEAIQQKNKRAVEMIIEHCDSCVIDIYNAQHPVLCILYGIDPDVDFALEILQLISNCVDINIQYHDDQTLLHKVIEIKNDKLFDFLIDKANIMLFDYKNCSLLDYARIHNYQRAIDIFSQNNDLVNIVDSNGQTALHKAVLGDRTVAIDTINFYLENGIDRAITDNAGKTAFDYAEQMNDREIMDLIQVIEPT